MSTRGLQPVRPLGADSAALAHILRQAGVDKCSIVRVTGPAGPTAMFWLGRLGFDRAAFVHASHVADMAPTDVLIALHVCHADDLAALVGDGRCLSDGGLLIAQTPSDNAGAAAVLALLSRLSMTVALRASTRGHHVVVARRAASDGFRQAA
jgi:hypothetical protein